MRRVLLAGGLFAAATIASAQFLTVASQFGEFVEGAPINVSLVPSDGSRMDCAAGMAVSRSGNTFVVSAWRLPGQRPLNECYGAGGTLGTLTRGAYTVEGRLYAPDGVNFAVETRVVKIEPLLDQCNPDPSMQPAIIARHPTLTPEQIAAKVAKDAAYAQKLGNPSAVTGYRFFDGTWNVYLTYPPLVDPLAMLVRLYKVDEFTWLGPNGYGCILPGEYVARFVEFHHAGLDHYFYTSDPGEIAAIDAGKVGPWVRTGEGFRAVVSAGCRTSDTPVYRFYGRPGTGPDSHFFTRDRQECRAVDKSGQWDFEGLPMLAGALEGDGTCPEGRVALYRVWRPFGVSNHRFTTSRAVVTQMVAKGWLDEGDAMCVRPST